MRRGQDRHLRSGEARRAPALATRNRFADRQCLLYHSSRLSYPAIASYSRNRKSEQNKLAARPRRFDFRWDGESRRAQRWRDVDPMVGYADPGARRRVRGGRHAVRDSHSLGRSILNLSSRHASRPHRESLIADQPQIPPPRTAGPARVLSSSLTDRSADLNPAPLAPLTHSAHECSLRHRIARVGPPPPQRPLPRQHGRAPRLARLGPQDGPDVRDRSLARSGQSEPWAACTHSRHGHGTRAGLTGGVILGCAVRRDWERFDLVEDAALQQGW